MAKTTRTGGPSGPGRVENPVRPSNTIAAVLVSNPATDERPDTPQVVVWVGGSAQPAHMNDTDLWFPGDLQQRDGYIVDLENSSKPYLRINIPDDGTATASWPDRIAAFFNGIRTGYFNEYGELRARAAKLNTVALRAMAHADNTTTNILEVTDSGQTATYLGVSKAAATATVPLAAPNVPVDKVRTSDATPVNNSTTLVADDTMTATLTAGTWIVEGTVIYDCAATADLKCRLNYTGTVTSSAFSAPVLTTAATSSATNQGNFAAREANSNFAAGGYGVGTGSLAALIFRGVLVVSTGGTLSIQYAQNAADASDLTVRAGSHLSYRKAS